MCIAIIIMGHNNWGKTTIVKELLGKQSLRGLRKAKILGFSTEFIVRSMSNDDITMNKYRDKIDEIPRDHNLLTCICPKEWPDNSFKEILIQCFGHFDRVFCIPVEYQWADEIQMVEIDALVEKKIKPSLTKGVIEVLPIKGKHNGNFKSRTKEMIIDFLIDRID